MTLENSIQKSPIMKSIRDERPTFYFKNNTENSIRAGGVLLYKFTEDTDEPEYLMINKEGKYEDFGGRTDIIDKCINDTIVRECQEESNNIINKVDIYPAMLKSKPVYCPRGKYMVYVVKTQNSYEPSQFGDREIHDDIPRTVEWVKHSDIMKHRNIHNFLHRRLKFNDFYNKLNNIYKNCVKKDYDDSDVISVSNSLFDSSDSDSSHNKKRYYHEISNEKRKVYMFV